MWLSRYLAVQKTADDRITKALKDAAEDIDSALKGLAYDQSISASVRRNQLKANRSIIKRVLDALFGEVGDTIRQGQEDAATAAVTASNVWDDKVLRQIIPDKDRLDAFKRSLERTAVRNIQTTVTKVTGENTTLARRLYRSEALAKGQIDRVVSSGIAKGDSAADIAKKVRPMVDPKVSGGISYVAQRLARTEINNAFHAQSISTLADRPWVSQVQWHLSGRHVPKPGDLCEAHARQSLFPAGKVPKKPHPNCFCFITAVVPDLDFVLHELQAGKYSQWAQQHKLAFQR